MNCEWVLERIEPYLDGELDGGEVSGLEAHLEQCAACAGELRLAGQVRDGLRELPLLACPEGVVDRVQERIREARWNRLREWIAGWWSPAWRPIGAVAVGVALLIGATTVYQQREQGPSPEEVALAERQVKWTLAYLGQVGQRTGMTVRDQVIRERLVEPLEQSVKGFMETETM